jgi:hypothetical protein
LAAQIAALESQQAALEEALQRGAPDALAQAA